MLHRHKKINTRPIRAVLLCCLWVWIWIGIFFIDPLDALSETTVPHKQSMKAMTRRTHAERVADLDRQIERLKTEQQKTTRQQVDLVESLDELDREVNRRHHRVIRLNKEIGQLEVSIEKARQQETTLTADIENNRSYTAERLKALHRMTHLERSALFPQPHSLISFQVRRRALATVIRADLAHIKDQMAVATELAGVSRRLAAERADRAGLDHQLAGEIQALEQQRRDRQGLLKKIKDRKGFTLAALEAAGQARQVLQEKMNQLAAAAKTGMAEKARENSDSSIPEGKNTGGEKTRGTDPDTASGFSRLKGRLPMPVPGKILASAGGDTGADDKTFTFQNGIDITVEMGEPVRSVFRGEVMYADWLRGYGNLMIINHGEHYYTLYAHMDELFKNKGDRVTDGEVIATAGDTGSLKGPVLYFEVRHHGEPIDPMEWLDKGA